MVLLLKGGVIAFSGMLASSFAIDRAETLYLTYGLMFGGGSSLCYTPSLVILGHYFKKNMGLVNGFVTAGSSLFTIAMPHILEGLLSSVGVSLYIKKSNFSYKTYFINAYLLVFSS